MEKRVIVFGVLSALMLMLYLSTQRGEEQPVGTPQTVEPGGITAPAGSGQPGGAREPAVGTRAVPGSGLRRAGAPYAAEEGDVIVDTSLYRARLSRQGAVLKSMRLLEYKEKGVGCADSRAVREQKLLADQLKAATKAIGRQAGALAKAEAEGRGPAVLEELGDQLAALQVQVERLEYLQIYLQERRAEAEAMEPGREREVAEAVELVAYEGWAVDAYLPAVEISIDGEAVGGRDAEFAASTGSLFLGERRPEGVVEFSMEPRPGIRIKRRYVFKDDSYVIAVESEVENRTGASITVDGAAIALGPALGLYESATSGRGATYETPIVAYRPVGISRAKVQGHKAGGFGCAPAKPGIRVWTLRGAVEWAALRSRYFVVAVMPAGETRGVVVERDAGRYQQVRVSLAASEVPDGGTRTDSFMLFAGPQDRQALNAAPGGLRRMLDMGMLGPIARWMHVALLAIHRVIPSYGWAILILCFAIKVVLYPVTRKSYDSMRKMQTDMKQIQPKLDAVKEKYKGNSQKLNKETMALYKREGMNPLAGCKGGCLPMLLQMPVFFSLYRVFNGAIELRNSSFAWLPDLAAPDPLKILPVLMGISMFFQQKLTGMGGGAGGTQQDQQKMMAYMMPVVLTFVFFRVNSGLVLYWLGFNVLTSLQQLIKKRPAS